ncbi:MAG: inactive transglutaminase family protein [Desulfobacteraceae bacterium]|jgi:hypothetical protein
MRNKHLFIVCLLLTAVGLGAFFYKVSALHFPLRPGTKTVSWNVEAHVTFAALGRPVKLSLRLPRNSRDYTLVNENFISKGYGLSFTAVEGKRAAKWSIRRAKGTQHLYYNATVRRMEREYDPADRPKELVKPDVKGAQQEAFETLIADIREKSADLETLVPMLISRINPQQTGEEVNLLLGKDPSTAKRIHIAVNALALLGVHGRSVHGIRLKDEGKEVPLVHWLEVYNGKQWVAYNVDNGESQLPEDYFPWWRGTEPIIETLGVQNAKVEMFVAANQESEIQSAIAIGKITRPVLHNFSIFSLPIQIQAIYRVLLIVPVGTFFLVILRNVIGIKTFGTFMPVLIALAFRETQLLWGIVLFTILVAAGMSVRLYLEHLKMLVVPRLAAVLTVVILLMLALSVVTHRLGLERGLSVALFPMVILAMTIERMSVIWDELGPAEAIKQASWTLFAAAGAYLVMSVQMIAHLVFVFPELLLVVLAGMLLLGRYGGYRLLELNHCIFGCSCHGHGAPAHHDVGRQSQSSPGRHRRRCGHGDWANAGCGMAQSCD